MNDKQRRTIAVLGGAVVVLLIVLVGVLVFGGHDTDTAAGDATTSTTAAVTTSTDPTTTTSSTTSTSTTTSTSSTTTTSTTSSTTTTSTTTTTTTTTTLPPPPAEVARFTADLGRGDLAGSGTSPLYAVSLSNQGFATSHPWWLVSTEQPGVEGCRSSSGGAVANPVGLAPLSLSTGWYGCSSMEDDHEAQLHLIVVETDPDRVVVEIVVWDYTP